MGKGGSVERGKRRVPKTGMETFLEGKKEGDEEKCSVGKNVLQATTGIN